MLLRESRAALTRRSYDPAGALTITGALVLLVYAVVKAPDVGWAEMRTILPLVGSAVLLAAFALIESRHHAPLVPLRILRSRTLAGANAVTVFIGTVGGRHAVRPHALRAAGARLLGPQVRHQLGGARDCGNGRRDRRSGRGPQGRLPLGRGERHGAHGRRVACAHPGLRARQLLSGHLLRAAPVRSRDRPCLRTVTVAALAGVAEHESGLASGLSNTALQIGSAPRRRHRHDGCRLPLRSDYLAANKGANPLVVLTEGFQSAFVACAVLAAIGMALALLLLGRPRKAARELPEPVPAVSARD